MESWTITEIAKGFDVSTRTIRYYEEKGLIHPKRLESGQRLYGKRDWVRLRLILRGKKFGFSLEEIAEMIELFDEDRTERKQLETTMQYGRKKIAEIDKKIESFIALKEEMQELMVAFESKLVEVKKEDL